MWEAIQGGMGEGPNNRVATAQGLGFVPWGSSRTLCEVHLRITPEG